MLGLDVDTKRHLLCHFLAALAYRTQKALRGAPANFAAFRAGPKVRTPHELVAHMASVLGYARTFFTGGEWRPPLKTRFEDEITGFHDILEDLKRRLEAGTSLRGITEEQLLQGPLADALTHAGQLAMLRRLAGSPVPPENFIYAEIRPENLGPDQPAPVRPDAVWPERP